jgi:hypothetical protein
MPRFVPTTTMGRPPATMRRIGVRRGKVWSGVKIIPAYPLATTFSRKSICPSTSSSRGEAFQYTSKPLRRATCVAPACSGSQSAVPQALGITATVLARRLQVGKRIKNESDAIHGRLRLRINRDGNETSAINLRPRCRDSASRPDVVLSDKTFHSLRSIVLVHI